MTAVAWEVALTISSDDAAARGRVVETTVMEASAWECKAATTATDWGAVLTISSDRGSSMRAQGSYNGSSLGSGGDNHQ